ncbi:MAG: glycosyltransferase, partial [Spirochaetia bacterium]|nr:glycosyltransferase [Spirochaetia bacterium]
VRLAICRFGNIELQLQHPIQTLKSLFDELFFRGNFTAIPQYKSIVVRYSPQFGFPDRAYIRAGKRAFLQARNDLGSIDLIHAQVGYPGGFVAMHLAREFGVPYVITEVMGPFPFPIFLEQKGLSPRLGEAMRNAAKVMAISPSLKETIESFGIKNVTCIPGFVDERLFFPTDQEVKDPIFFALSNLSVEKGTDDLLDAMQILIKQHGKKFRLRIGGPGDLAHYREMALGRGIHENVEFLGALTRENAAAEFRKAFAFVLPSRHETFGMVYAEALASGLPVIAARAGGPESIVDEKNGILVPVADPAAIAGAMIQIVDSRNQYKAPDIRAGFMRRFSRKVVVEQVRKVYEEALAKQGSGRN